MKKLNISSLLKGKFLQSLMILASGSLIAQLMVAGEQLVLTRIFSPEALGIYAFLMAFPHACTGVICGRYELAIVYEEKDDNVFALVKLNLLINLILSTVLTAGYAGYLFFFKTEYRQYLYLVLAVFVYLFSFGLTGTLNSYNNRHGQYKSITKMHMLRTFTQCFGTVGLGLIVVVAMGDTRESVSVPLLMIPYCVGMLCGVSSQAKELLQNRKKILSVSGKELWQIALKHKKQPLISAPAIFANGYSYSAVTMFIEDLFGEAVTGYYSMSTKLLGMPISLISSNISKVYMEEAAKEYNATGCYKKAFRKTFLFLLALAVPMLLCMYFLAPPVCAWLFGGENWRIAGEYIKILAPMFAFRFIATALSPGLYVCRKQGAEFVVHITLLGLTVIAGMVCAAMKTTVEQFLWAICITRSIAMLLCIVMVYYYSKGTGESKNTIQQESKVVKENKND